MLTIKFEIMQSKINGAGLGLFAQELIPQKKIIAFPNQQHTLFSHEQMRSFSDDSIEKVSSIRWFENTYSSDVEWSEESHFNHSFSPNCLWHLGFVFALRDIAPGEELTLNYEWLLDEHTKLDFLDSATGLEVCGIAYEEKIKRTTHLLLSMFK